MSHAASKYAHMNSRMSNLLRLLISYHGAYYITHEYSFAAQYSLCERFHSQIKPTNMPGENSNE